MKQCCILSSSCCSYTVYVRPNRDPHGLTKLVVYSMWSTICTHIHIEYAARASQSQLCLVALNSIYCAAMNWQNTWRNLYTSVRGAFAKHADQMAVNTVTLLHRCITLTKLTIQVGVTAIQM